MSQITLRKNRARFIKLPEPDPSKSIYEQLRDHLRDLIATGAISPGARMPSQRILARDLKISRNTVTSAYEALTSEGLLEGKLGAGTYVVDRPSLSPQKRALARVGDPQMEQPLHQGIVALELFPIDLWRRLQERAWRRIEAHHLWYSDPAGYAQLRYILAQRLAAIRGVHCSPEQIQIVPTALQGLRLVCAACDIAGHKVWIEQLGYRKVLAALRASSAKLIPLPIDAKGADIAYGIAQARDARLAYLSPTAQFPLGMPLAPERRTALLAWAKAQSAWVVEDDYEAEFAFEGQAAPPLAAAPDGGDRVIHIGTMNNLLFPAAQLAYVVAPEALVDRIAEVRRTFDYSVNAPLQMVLHDFIDGGHLASHVRRCREVYSERRALLRRLCTERLGDHLKLLRQPVGLHVSAYLRPGVSDADMVARAAAQKVVVHAFSENSAVEDNAAGVFFGFAGYTPQTLQEAVGRLAKAFDAN